MVIKAATDEIILKVGPDVIGIAGVKGNETLKRIVINKSFVGYIQKREGHYHRIHGSNIHDLIFARICNRMYENS